MKLKIIIFYKMQDVSFGRSESVCFSAVFSGKVLEISLSGIFSTAKSMHMFTEMRQARDFVRLIVASDTYIHCSTTVVSFSAN